MIPFRKTSMLHGLNAIDPDSIKRTMHGVFLALAGHDEATYTQEIHLTDVEAAIVGQIAAEAAGNDHFHRLATRFASALNSRDSTVLSTANEFVLLTPPTVVGPERLRVEEDVEGSRMAMEWISQSGIEFTGTEEEEEDNVKPAKGRSSSKSADKKKAESVKPAKGRSSRKRAISSLNDAQSSNKRARSERHIPIRRKDERIVDDGTFDRKVRPKLNEKNEALLTISLKAEKLDKETNTWKPRDPLVWDFRKISANIDWSDKGQVEHLHKWRLQVLSRNLGAAGEHRWGYTIEEQNKMIRLHKKYLNMPGIDGRWSKLDKDGLANEFNTYFKGRTIRKDHPIAPTSYNHSSGIVVTTEERTVSKDRPFEARSGAALHNQMEHFVHPTCKSIVRKAKEADRGHQEPKKAKENGEGGKEGEEKKEKEGKEGKEEEK